MKKNRALSFTLLLGVALLLSACGSAFSASSWPGITYDETSSTIYVAYNQHVYALQAENGAEFWRFPVDPENSINFYAPPTLSEDGQLLVSGYNNQVYSLDPANNGRENWAFAGAANRFIGSPASNALGVFAPNSDHKLYALTPEGALQWTFASQEPQWASPAADESTIYVPSMDHHLYALNAADGELLWDKDLGGTIVGRPALSADGILFVGTFGQEVLALRASNGAIQWRASTEGWVWSGPSLADGVVYAGDVDGFVYAFNAETGRQLWRVTADSAITGTPLVAHDSIYVTTENGQVLSISLDGRIQWTETVAGQAYSSPVAAGDAILIGITESEENVVIIALDAANGNVLWSFAP
ncbi:MAG: hypothetical protein DWG76_05820 [Chloroflexi bacterium]|nr:hypothetical protein [Chloroflexota bacterium]